MFLNNWFRGLAIKITEGKNTDLVLNFLLGYIFVSISIFTINHARIDFNRLIFRSNTRWMNKYIIYIFDMFNILSTCLLAFDRIFKFPRIQIHTYKNKEYMFDILRPYICTYVHGCPSEKSVILKMRNWESTWKQWKITVLTKNSNYRYTGYG